MANLGSILGGILQNYTNTPQQPADVEGYSHNDVFNHYQQFAQQASPEQLYQAHQQYYQQLPQTQREGLFGSIVNALTQQGINPTQTGIQGNTASANNLAQMSQYIGRNPGLSQSIFGQGGLLSSPLAKMALTGALSYAAKKFMGR